MENDPRSIADLVRELRNELTLLLRQEVALARTEVSEKLAMLARGVALLAVGAALGYAGLVFLLLALASTLTTAMVEIGLPEPSARTLGPLAIGGVVGAVGTALALRGLARLRARNAVPRETIDSLREGREWLGQKIR